MSTNRTTLQQLIAQSRIRMTCEYGTRQEPKDDWQRQANGYTCTIRYQRRQMTVDYWMGPAHTDEPDLPGVLDCLLSNASGYLNARDFEDWAGEYGYDPDSRKAERIYRDVERQTKRLERLFGSRDELERWLYADRD